MTEMLATMLTPERKRVEALRGQVTEKAIRKAVAFLADIRRNWPDNDVENTRVRISGAGTLIIMEIDSPTCRSVTCVG